MGFLTCVVVEQEEECSQTAFVTEVEEESDNGDNEQENNIISYTPEEYYFKFYLINQADDVILDDSVQEISQTMQLKYDVKPENIEMFKIVGFHLFYPIVEESLTKSFYEFPLTSMVCHQLCNTGLFEDFQEVEQITSMQSHVLANLPQIEENNDRELPLNEHETCHNE